MSFCHRIRDVCASLSYPAHRFVPSAIVHSAKAKPEAQMAARNIKLMKSCSVFSVVVLSRSKQTHLEHGLHAEHDDVVTDERPSEPREENASSKTEKVKGEAAVPLIMRCKAVDAEGSARCVSQAHRTSCRLRAQENKEQGDKAGVQRIVSIRELSVVSLLVHVRGVAYVETAVRPSSIRQVHY